MKAGVVAGTLPTLAMRPTLIQVKAGSEYGPIIRASGAIPRPTPAGRSRETDMDVAIPAAIDGGAPGSSG